jgi:DNA invertase Pin-like site-specific DNA recombinase
MITVLGGLAEFERSLILARTADGRVRAKARGVKFDRKPVLTAPQQAEALARRAAGEPLVDIAWILLGPTTSATQRLVSSRDRRPPTS